MLNAKAVSSTGTGAVGASLRAQCLAQYLLSRRCTANRYVHKFVLNNKNNVCSLWTGTV